MTPKPSPEELEAIRHLVNNQPQDDFFGLSSNEMHRLIWHTFEPDSPLKINSKISSETLNQLPFFCLTEELLKIIRRDGYIKLTPLGALPKKALTELYGHRLILEEGIELGIHKLTREVDSPVLSMLHYNTGLSGLVKKLEGKLVLTKEAAMLLTTKNSQRLFEITLQSYTQKLPWGNIDGYPWPPVGNLGWGFTIFMLLNEGNATQSASYYASKYLKAFPEFFQALPKSEFSSHEHDLVRCYSLRCFERFLEWWGFVKAEGTRPRFDKERAKYTATVALKEVFRFDD